MKRDLDVVRKILLAMEAKPVGTHSSEQLGIQDVEPEVLAEHARLLVDAGLITAAFPPGSIPRTFAANRITWAGHEYLSAVHSDTVWNKVKTTAAEKGVTLTIEVAKLLAVSFAKTLLGLPPA